MGSRKLSWARGIAEARRMQQMTLDLCGPRVPEPNGDYLLSHQSRNSEVGSAFLGFSFPHRCPHTINPSLAASPSLLDFQSIPSDHPCSSCLSSVPSLPLGLPASSLTPRVPPNPEMCSWKIKIMCVTFLLRSFSSARCKGGVAVSLCKSRRDGQYCGPRHHCGKYNLWYWGLCSQPCPVVSPLHDPKPFSVPLLLSSLGSARSSKQTCFARGKDRNKYKNSSLQFWNWNCMQM